MIDAVDRRSEFNGDGGVEAIVQVRRDELGESLRALGIHPRANYGLEYPPENEKPEEAPPYPSNPSFTELSLPKIERYIEFNGPKGPVIVDLTGTDVRTLYLFYALAT